MRRDLFDESKIIKKNDAPQEVQREVDNLPAEEVIDESIDNKSEIEQPEIEEQLIEIIEDLNNVRSSITINHKQIKPEPIKSKSVKSRPVVQNSNNNEKIQVSVSSKPVFVFSKDRNTNEIQTHGFVKNDTISVDIPRDQLIIINNNTKKYYNELILEIEILKKFRNNDNNMIEFCNNKLSMYENELKYVEYKKSVLNDLLKK